MQLSVKIQNLYNYFWKTAANTADHERVSWNSLNVLIMETVEQCLKDNNYIPGAATFNTFVKIPFSQLMGNLKVHNVPGFNEVDSILEGGKVIINEYFDIMSLEKSSLVLVPQNKAIIYFFKILIPIFYKWCVTPGTDTNNDVAEFNKKLGNTMTVIISTKGQKDCYINDLQFRELFAKNKNIVYELIMFIETLQKKYDDNEHIKKMKSNTPKISVMTNNLCTEIDYNDLTVEGLKKICEFHKIDAKNCKKDDYIVKIKKMKMIKV